jgi:Transposase DDE domain
MYAGPSQGFSGPKLHDLFAEYTDELGPYAGWGGEGMSRWQILNAGLGCLSLADQRRFLLELCEYDGPAKYPLPSDEDVARLRAAGLQVLADSAYGSGPTRAALRDAKHVQAIKALPLRRAVPGGFDRDDFVIDRDARSVTCPAGHTVAITPKGVATFGVRCRGCPLVSRCTTSKTGRTLRIDVHDAELVEARRTWREGDFAADYRRWRPMVERSIAWRMCGAGSPRRDPSARARMRNGTGSMRSARTRSCSAARSFQGCSRSRSERWLRRPGSRFRIAGTSAVATFRTPGIGMSSGRSRRRRNRSTTEPSIERNSREPVTGRRPRCRRPDLVSPRRRRDCLTLRGYVPCVGRVVAEMVGTQSHHHPSLWLLLSIFVPAYALAATAIATLVPRLAGGPSWRVWRDHARHLSVAQRWAIFRALSRRKRVGDERLVPAMLARIQLARTLLGFTRRRAFRVVRWVGGLLLLILTPYRFWPSTPRVSPRGSGGTWSVCR